MSTDQQQSSPAANDTSAATDEDPKNDQQGGAGDEEHGSDSISADVLINANSFATESRALDAASAVFGLQTNQQINFLGTARTAAPYQTTRFSVETLARVRGTFVVPDDYTDLRNQLLDTNLVILSGRLGSGRQYLATHILDALCDGRVDHLNGGALADLDVDVMAEDAGHLWTGIAEGASGAVETSVAERLVEALRERQAHMIILWPDSARWPFELDHHRYTLEGPLDLAAIVRLHLQSDPDGLESAVAELLSHPEVAAAQAKLGGAEEAARLGLALKAVVLGRSTVTAALSKAGEGTTDWFAALPEREDKAFALALAALNELSYPTVVAGARRMDELLQQAEDPQRRSFIRPFARPTRQLLAAVEAVKTPKLSVTSYGEVPIMTVESNRNDFPREMLKTLWHEFPYLQEVYLDWLAELVDNPDPYVRDRAAVITGLLAKDDFDFVRGRLLSGWARSDKREVRRAAGIALRAPALSNELKGIVWQLLDEWAAPADGPGRLEQNLRRMTAAAALGGPVGATDCGRALEIIGRRLLEWRPGPYSYRLWSATILAVVDLFGDGGSAQSTAVLQQMVEWAGEKDLGPLNVAIGAMGSILARPPVAGYRDKRQLAPVLRSVETDPKNLVRIAGLWRLAFNDRLMAKTSIVTLLRLAEHVDDTGGDDLLIALVRALPETERERRTLRYEIRQWTEETSYPSILDRLLDLMSSPEVTR